MLVHDNYLSQEDIGICLGFDLSDLSGQKEYANMRQLHETLIAEHRSD